MFDNVEFSENSSDNTPPVGTETPPVGTETPPAGTETPPAGTETPPVGTETPPAGTETPPVGGKKAKKTLKAIQGGAGEKTINIPKKDPPIKAAEADKTETAKKVKDEETARVHAEMWVFTFNALISNLGKLVTGQPASRYELTPSQAKTYKEVSYQYFKIASWGISPAVAFYLQTLTIFGMIGMLVYFDWKEKIKRDREILAAKMAEIKKQQFKPQPQKQQQQQQPQQPQQQENKTQTPIEEPLYIKQEKEEAKEMPPIPENKPRQPKAKAADFIELLKRYENSVEIPKKLTASYLSENVPEIVNGRSNFEVYPPNHRFEGLYKKNTGHDRLKFEELAQNGHLYKPSALVAREMGKMMLKGNSPSFINKKIRHLLDALRVEHNFKSTYEDNL